MSRRQVFKGAMIVKKDEKIATLIRDVGVDADFDTFFEAFKATYPKDWARVCHRYEELGRLNKPGKRTSMANPPKHMEEVFRAFHKKLKERGQTPEEYLHILGLPKSERPQFQDGEPPRELSKMLRGAKHKDMQRRILAVNRLGKYRCEASVKALREVLSDDSSQEIRMLAYEKLSRFGEEDLPSPTG